MEYVQAQHKDIEVYWIGERNSLEARIIGEADITFRGIVCGKLRRYMSWWTFFVPFQILIGIAQSLSILARTRTTHVFSK